MTDAPETIVASVDYDSINRARYIKRTSHLALVAEAYEAAATYHEERKERERSEAKKYRVNYNNGDDDGSYGLSLELILMHGESADDIRTMTPSEALAAREARDKRVRDDALREAAEICTAAKDKRNKQRNDHPGESRDVKQRWMAGALQSQYNADAILALIEGDQTNDG